MPWRGRWAISPGWSLVASALLLGMLLLRFLPLLVLIAILKALRVLR